MKKLALVLFVASLVASAHAEPLAEDGHLNVTTPYSFTVAQKQFEFADYYEMADMKNAITVSVKQSGWSLSPKKLARKCAGSFTFDLYKTNGMWDATATSRFLFPFTITGAWSLWGTDMDITGSDGSHLGTIQGSFFTYPAVFGLGNPGYTFYDRKGNKVGIASMDRERTGFTISDPCAEMNILATLTRKFDDNITDTWTVDVVKPAAIDHRLIKMFAVFALKFQDSFKHDIKKSSLTQAEKLAATQATQK